MEAVRTAAHLKQEVSNHQRKDSESTRSPDSIYLGNYTFWSVEGSSSVCRFQMFTRSSSQIMVFTEECQELPWISISLDGERKAGEEC